MVTYQNAVSRLSRRAWIHLRPLVFLTCVVFVLTVWVGRVPAERAAATAGSPVPAAASPTTAPAEALQQSSPPTGPQVVTIPAPDTTPPTGPMTTSTSTRAPVHAVVLGPRGFEPAQITRPAGPFYLMVHTNLRLRSFTLRLDQEGGSRRHEVQIPLRTPRWHATLDLPPGRYILTEANRPRWSCRITIR